MITEATRAAIADLDLYRVAPGHTWTVEDGTEHAWTLKHALRSMPWKVASQIRHSSRIGGGREWTRYVIGDEAVSPLLRELTRMGGCSARLAHAMILDWFGGSR